MQIVMQCIMPRLKAVYTEEEKREDIPYLLMLKKWMKKQVRQ